MKNETTKQTECAPASSLQRMVRPTLVGMLIMSFCNLGATWRLQDRVSLLEKEQSNQLSLRSLWRSESPNQYSVLVGADPQKESIRRVPPLRVATHDLNDAFLSLQWHLVAETESNPMLSIFPACHLNNRETGSYCDAWPNDPSSATRRSEPGENK